MAQIPGGNSSAASEDMVPRLLGAQSDNGRCSNCGERVAFIRTDGKVKLAHGEPMKLFSEGADVVIPTNRQIKDLMPRLAGICKRNKGGQVKEEF